MIDPQKISPENFKKSEPRGLADPIPEPEEQMPSVEEMIDIFFQVMMKRMDDLDDQLQTIIESCQEMKSRS
jgi:hypothetical protein